MARNDNILADGLNNTPIAHQQELRERRMREKTEQRHVIEPRAEEILAMIDKEIATTEKEILSFVGIATTQEVLKETLVALNLYETSCKKLRTKFQNILRGASL